MSSRNHMFAKVILASQPTTNAPTLITIHARYPRIIHGEVMTHRVFSRNARSSRAVPVNTMLKEVQETPFVPWHWGKNQKGMQATEECLTEVHNWSEYENPIAYKDQFLSNEDAWLKACDQAVRAAQAFSEAGYHKQIVNRLLEPFSWIDTLITSTSWENFFHLRDHPDAEPHFRDLAQMIREAIDNADVYALRPGHWHLPYVTDPEEWKHLKLQTLQKLSVARCARISYKPFDGDASIDREIERYEHLVGSSPLHASPAEHQAMVDDLQTTLFTDEPTYPNAHLSGNLGPGWLQFRKLLPREFVPG